MDTHKTLSDPPIVAASPVDAAPSTLTPFVVPAAGAARLSGVSRAQWWKMHSAGRTPAPVRVSARKPVWLVSELRAWLEAGAPDRQTWEKTRERKGARQ